MFARGSLLCLKEAYVCFLFFTEFNMEKYIDKKRNVMYCNKCTEKTV